MTGNHKKAKVETSEKTLATNGNFAVIGALFLGGMVSENVTRTQRLYTRDQSNVWGSSLVTLTHLVGNSVIPRPKKNRRRPKGFG